jgi:rod shape-determining protein MreC
VAEVTSVEQDPGNTFSTVEARPRANLDRSREVLLVWPPKLLEPEAGPAAGAAATPDKATEGDTGGDKAP